MFNLKQQQKQQQQNKLKQINQMLNVKLMNLKNEAQELAHEKYTPIGRWHK
jgi:hypothetical protein